MAKKILSNVILFILLFAAAFLGREIGEFKKLPVKPNKILEFPYNLGDYKSRELSLEQNVYKILNTDTIVARMYSKANQIPLWLIVVYGEEDRQSFHPPEYCYLGAGNVELLKKNVEPVSLKTEVFYANTLLFKVPHCKELVFYWYTAGSQMTASYYKQQFFFVKEQIKGNRIGGSLIRVSTVVLEKETEEDAKKRIIDFLNLAVPELKKML